MKKITIKAFAFGCGLWSAIGLAQQKQISADDMHVSPDGYIRCSSDQYNKEMLKSYPNMMGSNEFESRLSQYIKDKEVSRSSEVDGTVIRIPVVVHVIHNGQAVGVGPNISDAQVLSQIQVLNDDYRRAMGTNGYNTHPDGADTEIEFYLAETDPNCNPTNGIDRVDMSAYATSWGGSGASSNTNTILKPQTIWDSSRYLNMWTVQWSSAGLLGFGQFPGGNAMTDGVVMGYQYFGSNDDPNVTLGGAYNLGRTTTHEVGHYLGLYHTFQGGCNGSGDGCADTPSVDDANYGCPTWHSSCGTPDMVQNYMDYTDDSCMNVFTNDQKARMLAVLANERSSLTNEGFSVESSTTQINLTIVTDNYGDETSWEFKDSSGAVLYSSPANTYDNNSTYNESFTVSGNQCYIFTINDEYGDGICCDYGDGSYELSTGDGSLIYSGGDFGSIESIQITTSTLGTEDYFVDNEVKVYPNPAKDVLNIKVNNNDLPDSYVVYNVLGQRVATKTISSVSDLSINTSELSNGMYFVKLSKQNANMSIPFIKE
ncbi:M43 family zinc metalloprotease [Mangrovimonas aestuarii]|uniref:M43 family zinc metalloprotease n=1 Tax=Mangrovimonas aestuarii TaxID=3018443 RepID=UPI0023799310|nr:M43 family zinc metalloprotease [Mangrovimonas aestuarii]